MKTGAKLAPGVALRTERMPTPIGEVVLLTDEREQLRALSFVDDEEETARLLRVVGGGKAATRSTPSVARRALEAYFAGELHAIERIGVEMGGTEFQRTVWTALREIPVGQTLSYGALAVKIGRPNAVRAVGLANGSNPIAIVVPCHRVLGSDGSLTGYGGGLERKRWLLRHEGAKLASVATGDLFRKH
jgi:methylated-DNA-[protein]-cysteine S-methyltransferase